MKRLLFLLFLPGFLLTCCYQEVDLNVPFEGSKMVLEGYISPGKGLDLEILKTFNPYEHTDFDEDGYFVTHAKVYIWWDGVLIDSCREIAKGQYLSLHPNLYRAGEVYEVLITAEGMEEVYVHDIRIPNQSHVSSDEYAFKMGPERNFLQLKVRLHNPETYTTIIGKSWHDSRDEHSLQTWIAMDEHIIDECEGDLLYVSNKCEAGAAFEAFFHSDLKERPRPGNFDPVFLPKSYIHFEVGQVDSRYRAYIEQSNASDEPFIEPSLKSGNVEDGYGFIVGWNTESFIYRL